MTDDTSEGRTILLVHNSVGISGGLPVIFKLQLQPSRLTGSDMPGAR